ncbi:MMPL family transporter [Vallicoccus soli]|uniref:MMPL family transporter n=1 Tax=Vallicoccus soli TaxID=2339232 RepID=A0A3A3Z0R6_9ACTN|nr:MMPL family transporter [Vallicoccus soli]RJK96101.1 MMPL family transporter [Vallicoccus soli]
MALRLFRLGAASVRRRVAVLLAWVVVLVAAGIGAVALSGPTSDAFEIPGQESTTALDLIGERFGDEGGGASAQVVLEAPDGAVTDPAVAQRVAAVVQRLGQLPGVASASDPLDPQAPSVSPDQRAAYSTVTYAVPAPEITEDEREALLAAVEDARGAGLTAEVTGEAVLEPVHVGGPAEVVGVVVALVVLALTYGTLVAAGMNLLTAVVGVGIGAAGVTALTGFVELQSTTPILAVMLGLAVGIDYALFIVTRHRAELRAGRPVQEAAALAVGTAGSAVLAAGLTVVIALAGLAVVGIPFLTEMGLAAAATVVIAVLVALTLVPAALGLLGHRVLPRRERAGGGERRERGSFAGWARTVTTRRSVSLLAAVAALAVVALPVADMRTSLEQRPAQGSTQERAEAVLDERFGPGVSGPLLVLVDGEGAVERAAQVAQEVQGLDDVALVTPPRPSADGSAALLTVVPASGPASEETVQLVEDLRDQLAGSSPRAYVTGETAVSVDVSQTLDEALPVYLVLVVGLAVVLLVLVFRSLLVPLAGVLGFLLTVGASLGATTAVFQWGWLADLVRVESTGPLLSLTPILVIGILFGLAMDYQVFLVSRMHEAHAHGTPPREAVVTGFRQAAPVVVAAAAIMFSVFAGFVPAGDATIKSIAFALAVGILVDALVVRMVVMPAALALLGARAWWLPRWLRWLPVLDVEGSALERRAPAGEPAPVR